LQSNLIMQCVDPLKRVHRCKPGANNCRNLLFMRHLIIMGLRTTVKRKVLEWSINSISEMFYRYVQKNPDCRLTHVSAAVLPNNLGKQSRLFASHVMDGLVSSGRVIKYKAAGRSYPQFIVN